MPSKQGLILQALEGPRACFLDASVSHRTRAGAACSLYRCCAGSLLAGGGGLDRFGGNDGSDDDDDEGAS